MSNEDKAKAEINAKLEQNAKKDQELHPEKYFLNPIGHIRDRIVINESSDLPHGGQYIALNGFGFLAKPNVEIDLPRPVRLMLDTRIKTETIHSFDEQTGAREVHLRDIPRITYRVIKLGVNLDKDGKIIKPEAAAKEW